MSRKMWHAEAPSNIALIKYMGKTTVGDGRFGGATAPAATTTRADFGDKNRPTNSSLSYTLSHLKTHVSLEATSDSKDRWEPLEKDQLGRNLEKIELSARGRERFLNHLKRIKEIFRYEGSFIVRSANDFPSDCGLASSASSFAALTKVTVQALSELTEDHPALTIDKIADLSRQGSGSSCRSFFAPWAFWSAEGPVREVSEIKIDHLIHQVIAVDENIKAVSSSEAHQRVATSLLFRGRPERAEERAADLVKALGREFDWQKAFEITWAEFWDMHALFETSIPSFGYMSKDSLSILEWVRESLWHEKGDGPLVTMDAGPNVHLLYRPDTFGLEAAEATKRKFGERFRFFSNEPAMKKS